jgi:hypothetical protein
MYVLAQIFVASVGLIVNIFLFVNLGIKVRRIDWYNTKIGHFKYFYVVAYIINIVLVVISVVVMIASGVHNAALYFSLPPSIVLMLVLYGICIHLPISRPNILTKGKLFGANKSGVFKNLDLQIQMAFCNMGIVLLYSYVLIAGLVFTIVNYLGLLEIPSGY